MRLISKKLYVETLLDRYGMKECKGARDVIPNLKLMDIVNDEKLTDTKQIKKIQSILVRARWLFRCTRIDIRYAVHMMSAASTNHTKKTLSDVQYSYLGI